MAELSRASLFSYERAARTGVSGQESALKVTCGQHDDQHYRHEPDDTTRCVTPAPAVRPARKHPEQGENHYDQEDRSGTPKLGECGIVAAIVLVPGATLCTPAHPTRRIFVYRPDGAIGLELKRSSRLRAGSGR
jgi:hypothetical protein